MSGDCDPRAYNKRERHHGIHDREDEWLVIGPDHDVAARDESNNHDARERDDDGVRRVTVSLWTATMTGAASIRAMYSSAT